MKNRRTEKLWLQLVFVTLFAVSACTRGGGEQRANRSPAETATQAGEITEITLDRSACHGECPAYRVTLRKGRPASYVGDAYVPMVGTYQAADDSCSDCDFTELATSLETQGFFNLKEAYQPDLMDSSRIVVSVTRNGVKKTVTSNDPQSPIELWGIAMTIDGVASKIRKWNKVSSRR